MGVDVFFVISGYLITSIIIGECATGQFSFLRFYQRRISRLFPVLLLVLLSTLVFASVLYTEQDFAFTGSVVSAAALSIANLKFMLRLNYFEVFPDAQPLLHFWSLSVEEQYYILFPFVFYMFYKYSFLRRNIEAILISLTILSFSANLIATHIKPLWAFYLLPTRAWELLIGCLLAANHNGEQGGVKQSRASLLSNIGLLLIFSAALFVDPSMQFPGFIAVIPVFGAVLVINCLDNTDNFAERLLSNRVLVFVGRASYSLYLWHWPINSFVDYSLYCNTVTERSFIKVLLTAIVSFLSYFFIEKPLRSYLNQPEKRFLCFTTATIGVFLLVVSGYSVRANYYPDARLNTVRDGGITINPSATKPVVVLFGDSNGAMYGGEIKEIAKEMGFRAHLIGVAEGDPFHNAKLFQDALFLLERTNPDVTIFVAAWAQKIGKNRERFNSAIHQLLKYSKHVVLITQPPILPEYASRKMIGEYGYKKIYESSDISKLRKNTNTFLLSQQNNRVHVIDIKPLLELKTGEIRFTDPNGKQIYQDATHLSNYGSGMAKKLIVAEIEKILSETSSVHDTACPRRF